MIRLKNIAVLVCRNKLPITHTHIHTYNYEGTTVLMHVENFCVVLACWYDRVTTLARNGKYFSQKFWPNPGPSSVKIDAYKTDKHADFIYTQAEGKKAGINAWMSQKLTAFETFIHLCPFSVGAVVVAYSYQLDESTFNHTHVYTTSSGHTHYHPQSETPLLLPCNINKLESCIFITCLVTISIYRMHEYHFYNVHKKDSGVYLEYPWLDHYILNACSYLLSYHKSIFLHLKILLYPEKLRIHLWGAI